nr:reverse transcriptase domain-containing protein [Tanacetum cinerariifolium]
MSTNEQTPLSQPTTAVRNTLGREQAQQNLVRPVPDEDLREYCDKNYYQILPIIAEKLHQENVQQEKLKAVKAHLNFEEASQNFESETPNRRRNLKERLGPRGARTRSISPEQRRGRSKSPKEKGPERRTMFKRLEKCVLHRLGDKEKNVSTHSRGSERKSYYSSRRKTERCYQSSRSKETEIASEKHRHKREYSRRTEAESESEGSAGGHWKSKPNKQKSSMEDDLSQPWRWEDIVYTAYMWMEALPRKSYEFLGGEITLSLQRDYRKAVDIVASKDRRRGTLNVRSNEFHGGEITLSLQRDYRKAVGEMAASNRERKKSFPSWKQETRQKQNFKRGNFWNEQRLEIKQDKFTLLTKTPREILALDKGKFKPPPPMTTQVEKTASSVSFMGRAKQQERSGKDSKEEGNLGKRQTAGNINGATMAKDSEARITQTFSSESVISFPTLREEDGTECPMIIEGYHQKKMAEEDEEKTAFITRQGIFCYSKMPFGLKNTGATYQHLVDKAFQKQIGRNLEKNKHEVKPQEVCFGMREGTFLGYKVDADGLRVSLDKVKVVIDLPSPKCLKDVQKLNGKLASLNGFLSKSAEKSLSFFKTLTKFTKKSDFQWTPEAEEAFKEMKQSIAELPMLTAPKEKEELIIYLAAAKEAISAVLMTERDGKQVPIYFAHTIVVITGQPIKQLLSNTEVTGRLLKWRFELGEHDIQYRPRTSVKGQILMDFIVERPKDGTPDTPIEDREELPDPWVLFMDRSSCVDGSGAGLIIMNSEGMEFTYALRFRFNATNNEAEYEALIAGLQIASQMGIQNLQANVDSKLVANQVNRIYIAKEEKTIDKKEILAVVEEEGHTWMTPVYEYLTEGVLPKEKKKERTVRHKAGRYPVINEMLYKKYFLDPWLRCVGPHQENYVLREIHEGSCSMHAGPRFVVAKALMSGYFLPTMHTNAKILIRECKDCQVHRPVPKNPQEKLTPITSSWPFYKWRIDIAGPFPEGPGKVARNKAKMEGYYNARVRSTIFCPGDFVYRNNEASHTKDGGKLEPKWEGPYKVTEVLGKGAYKLKDRNGHTLPRTWNIRNLKKCYMKCKHPFARKAKRRKKTLGILFVCNIF